MICTSYPTHAARAALPALYDRAHALLSQRASLCLIELARRSYGPLPSAYGPLTVVVEPKLFAEELRLPLSAVWPALEELAAHELLIPRELHTVYLFDPHLSLVRLRSLETVR